MYGNLLYSNRKQYSPIYGGNHSINHTQLRKDKKECWGPNVHNLFNSGYTIRTVALRQLSVFIWAIKYGASSLFGLILDTIFIARTSESRSYLPYFWETNMNLEIKKEPGLWVAGNKQENMIHLYQRDNQSWSCSSWQKSIPLLL